MTIEEHPENRGVSNYIDYALIKEKAWFNSEVPASSYKGQCDLINGELTPKKASHGKTRAKTVCRITRPTASKNYCWFWWLGRNCVAVEVIHEVFREKRFRILIIDAINNTCKYLSEHYGLIDGLGKKLFSITWNTISVVTVITAECLEFI